MEASNMMAIIEQGDSKQGCYTDNTAQFYILILLKVCLDFGALFLCYVKPLRSFLNMCSVSIVLVDHILIACMTTLWMDVHRSHAALCFIMAHFSAAYAAVPVPMLCLAILDYYLQDTWAGREYIKMVRNTVLMLLTWVIAGIYSYSTIDATLLEQKRNVRYLLCEIQESKVVAYSVVAVSTLMVCAMLPYWSLIPQWLKEANRISEAREELVESKKSDLIITKTVTPEEDIKPTKEDFAMPRPPMHISLILGFGVFWITYLAATTLCVVFDFGIPAYINVNLLWVQCVNSLLAGTVFWLRSDTERPYSSLPENVCLWQAYWQLSTGTEAHQQQPATMSKPSKGKKSTPFYV